MPKESTSSIFSKLKILEITSCVNLKFVLPNETRDLSQLQKLVISSCAELEMIFGDDDANDNKATLSCLKTITLRFLPRLSSFGRAGLIVDCPDLVKLEVLQCIRNLKRLPFSMQSIPKLKALVVNRNWFDGLKWTDESLKFHLQSLIRVEHSSYVGDMYFQQTSVDYFGGNDGEEDEEVESEEGGEVADDGLNAVKQMARFYNMPTPVLAFIFTFLFFILFTTQF